MPRPVPTYEHQFSDMPPMVWGFIDRIEGIWAIWEIDDPFSVSRSVNQVSIPTGTENSASSSRYLDSREDPVESQVHISASPLKTLNLGWASDAIVEELGELEPWNGADFESHWKWHGFLCGTLSRNRVNQRFSQAYVVVPCWSIVTPLSLLAAWLMFTKSRPAKKPIQPTEPDHA
jgi:hypothetical protein